MDMIVEEIKKLRKSSHECIDNSKPIHVPEAMAPGDMLPQGDIGLLLLEFTEVPASWAEFEWPKEGDMQLAPGNTKGSRHTIPRKYASCVRLFRINDGDPLSDMGLLASGTFDLEHPEHADHLGYSAGVYRVRHQQNEQRMRVVD